MEISYPQNAPQMKIAICLVSTARTEFVDYPDCLIQLRRNLGCCRQNKALARHEFLAETLYYLGVLYSDSTRWQTCCKGTLRWLRQCLCLSTRQCRPVLRRVSIAGSLTCWPAPIWRRSIAEEPCAAGRAIPRAPAGRLCGPRRTGRALGGTCSPDGGARGGLLGWWRKNAV
jgi:hypothetical protein